MSLFGGKKKTYSGVGSAVQNLLADKLDNNLNTLTVSAQQNNTDLGEAFKKFLADGSGLKLRSVIDYAHQKGYTNTLGWKVSQITGEVFSDSTAYTNYLGQYVYPSGASTETSPETVASETVTNEASYRLGNDQVTEKTIHRIVNKTITTTTTTQSFTNNLYYQGKHTEFLTINNFLNTDLYKNLSDYAKDTAIAVTGDVSFYESGSKYATGKFYSYPNVTMLLIAGQVTGSIKKHNLKIETIPTSKNGFVVASIDKILNLTCLETPTHTSGDGSDVKYNDTVTYGSVAANDAYKICRQNWDSFIGSPSATLNLSDPNSVNIVQIKFVIGMDDGQTVNVPGGYDGGSYTETTYYYYPSAIWFNCYALITNAKPLSTKVLVANIDVHKVVNKLTSVVSTEYVITEKYVNGVLTSSSTEVGAINTQNSTQTLEDRTFTHLDSYSYGTGNSRLDSIIDNTRSITEQFMPVMPIKTWGNMCSSAWGDLYTAERKLYKKITSKTLGKWDEFVDSFKDVGDDAKMVYYFPAVPINVDHEFANEYFFHFFKWLAINFNGINYFGSDLTIALQADNNIDFKLKYNFQVSYKVVNGTPPVPCKIHNYARYHVIGTKEADDSVSESWSGGFDDEWGGFNASGWLKLLVKKLKYDPTAFSASETYIGSRENYPDLTDDEYNALVASSTYTVADRKSLESSSISFYYKVSDTLYEKVYITNFCFHHYVRNHSLEYYLKNSLSKDWRKAIDEEATNEKDAGFSPIIIPIARGVLESMGWYRQSNLLQVCHNIIVSGYDQKTIKTKWYQSGLFSVIVIVVAVVITVCSWGSSSPVTAPMAAGAAGSAGGAAAAGIGVGAMTTTLTMAAIADMAIQAIACCLIAKAISYVANKYIGGILGTVVSIVGTVVASYYVTGYYRQNLAFSGTAEATSMTETLWDSLCSWDGFMNITKITMDNVFNYANVGLQQSYSDFQNYYSSVVADQDTKSQQMKVWTLQQNSWGNDNLTGILVDSTYSYASTYKDTLQFTMPEDPDAFQTRIRGEVDIWDTTIAYTENFFDLLEAGSQPYPLNLY